MHDQKIKPWLVKVSANDSTPLIYFPKKLREVFGIKKGDYLEITVDLTKNQLVLKKVIPPTIRQLTKPGSC